MKLSELVACGADLEEVLVKDYTYKQQRINNFIRLRYLQIDDLYFPLPIFLNAIRGYKGSFRLTVKNGVDHVASWTINSLEDLFKFYKVAVRCTKSEHRKLFWGDEEVNISDLVCYTSFDEMMAKVLKSGSLYTPLDSVVTSRSEGHLGIRFTAINGKHWLPLPAGISLVCNEFTTNRQVRRAGAAAPHLKGGHVLVNTEEEVLSFYKEAIEKIDECVVTSKVYPKELFKSYSSKDELLRNFNIDKEMISPTKTGLDLSNSPRLAEIAEMEVVSDGTPLLRYLSFPNGQVLPLPKYVQATIYPNGAHYMALRYKGFNRARKLSTVETVSKAYQEMVSYLTTLGIDYSVRGQKVGLEHLRYYDNLSDLLEALQQ